MGLYMKYQYLEMYHMTKSLSVYQECNRVKYFFNKFAFKTVCRISLC